ncbi:unnamed protein product [Ilex paraguariensis]|uniref:Uncharacterized protein n=1 Tax=Ilex paraguariensis TaxID=185542 RepID=A0ABC8SMR6_9AQUA
MCSCVTQIVCKASAKAIAYPVASSTPPATSIAQTARLQGVTRNPQHNTQRLYPMDKVRCLCPIINIQHPTDNVQRLCLRQADNVQRLCPADNAQHLRQVDNAQQTMPSTCAQQTSCVTQIVCKASAKAIAYPVALPTPPATSIAQTARLQGVTRNPQHNTQRLYPMDKVRCLCPIINIQHPTDNVQRLCLRQADNVQRLCPADNAQHLHQVDNAQQTMPSTCAQQTRSNVCTQRTTPIILSMHVSA